MSVVVEPEELPLERLEAEITELAGQLAAGECRWLLLVAEFDRREGWASWGCRSCAHWLSWQCGLDARSARDKLRVARALIHLPEIREAFAAGRLSYSKARALTRIGTPNNERDLVMLAEHSTTAQLERVVRSYRRVIDADEEVGAANERHARRHVGWQWDEDGSFVMRVRLDPEEGAQVLASLDAMHAALSEARAGVSYADALVAMAETARASEPAARAGGVRHHAMLNVDAQVLSDDGDGACDVDGGPSLAAETGRRLTCESSIVAIVKDALGQPLDVGRRRRTIPAAIRRALRARDGGCRFPGCGERRFVDGHHVRHWAKGGRTSLANLVELCWFHHRLVHEGGYGIELGAHDAVRFVAPGGRVLEPLSRSSAFGGDLEQRNRERGVAIAAGSARGVWYGDPLDLDLTITGLLCLDGRLGKEAPDG